MPSNSCRLKGFNFVLWTASVLVRYSARVEAPQIFAPRSQQSSMSSGFPLSTLKTGESTRWVQREQVKAGEK